MLTFDKIIRTFLLHEKTFADKKNNNYDNENIVVENNILFISLSV